MPSLRSLVGEVNGDRTSEKRRILKSIGRISGVTPALHFFAMVREARIVRRIRTIIEDFLLDRKSGPGHGHHFGPMRGQRMPTDPEYPVSSSAQEEQTPPTEENKDFYSKFDEIAKRTFSEEERTFSEEELSKALAALREAAEGGTAAERGTAERESELVMTR